MLSSRLVLLGALGVVLYAVSSCGPTTNEDPGLEHVEGAGAAAGTGVSGGSGGSGGVGSAPGSGGTIAVGGRGMPTEEECTPPTGPFCGDAMVNQATETCDDGNAMPGDGCNGVCSVEPFSVCPPGGGPCTSTLRCGDGMRSPGEACDDGNVDPNDGCAPDCLAVDPGYYCPTPGELCMRSEGECGDSKVQPGETCDDGGVADGDGCTVLCRVEPGWRCTQPGMPCILVPECGNGKKEGAEECDDLNTNSADGCSSTCRVEIGWLCETPGMPCRQTKCGDGKQEGSECCDDGNQIPLDGCTAECRCEPSCPVSGACTAKCGNGIVEGAETCDDGNLASGDGCTATCQPEPGFTCTTPACEIVDGDCVLIVPVTYRDFNGHAATGGHPDFQPGFNSSGAVQGLVQDALDMEGKPVLSSKASSDGAGGFLHGQTTFAQWYRNGTPSGGASPGEIVLWDNGAGGFVNRWGANGEQWQGKLMPSAYDPVVYGGPGGTGCEACTPSATGQCYDPCIPWNGSTQACCAEIPTGNGYDGNPLFFPMDTAKEILTEPRTEGKVPSQYGWNGWPWETAVADELGIGASIPTATAPFPSNKHNYSFTTEVLYWFKYDATTNATLDFTGDDDVWVFLNGKLAVDLGGWHVPLNGRLTINGATINAVTQVTADDAGATLTQTMKNGTATTYGMTAGNVYQIKIFHAERQVEGSSFKLTLAGFSLIPSDCKEQCGDGVVTISEECDAGAANSDSACGACTTTCKFGPRCGDGITQADCSEECDDGVNVGGYNQCDVGCVLGPRCGDGMVQEDFGEQCDDGINDGTACNSGCGVPAFCGDGAVQVGEECDDGVNDNSYGGCSTDCHYGPRCGDGVVQAESGETCDSADMNDDTAYGGCTTLCKSGPHCGDGIVQADEKCDAGPDGMSMSVGVPTNPDDSCNALNSVCTETCQIKPIKDAK
jgi:fibro-slime domain-containing protein